MKSCNRFRDSGDAESDLCASSVPQSGDRSQHFDPAHSDGTPHFDPARAATLLLPGKKTALHLDYIDR